MTLRSANSEGEDMEEKKTVLIVEDEKSIVDIIRFNLEKEGKALASAASSGRRATMCRSSS